jgi:hypothetical protein
MLKRHAEFHAFLERYTRVSIDEVDVAQLLEGLAGLLGLVPYS